MLVMMSHPPADRSMFEQQQHWTSLYTILLGCVSMLIRSMLCTASIIICLIGFQLGYEHVLSFESLFNLFYTSLRRRLGQYSIVIVLLKIHRRGNDDEELNKDSGAHQHY